MDDHTSTGVVLREADGLTITARRTASGGVVLHGQDLKAAEFFGEGFEEYEYGHTVAPVDVPRFLAALGEPPDADPLDACSRNPALLTAADLEGWLTGHGIAASFWSRLT